MGSPSGSVAVNVMPYTRPAGRVICSGRPAMVGARLGAGGATDGDGESSGEGDRLGDGDGELTAGVDDGDGLAGISWLPLPVSCTETICSKRCESGAVALTLASTVGSVALLGSWTLRTDKIEPLAGTALSPQMMAAGWVAVLGIIVPPGKELLMILAPGGVTKNWM